MALGITILGIAFLYSGKVDSVVLDKQIGLISVIRTSILCRTKRRAYDLGDVVGISVIKKGHEGINFYTLHYVIQAEFKKGRPVKILESQNKEKIVKQVSKRCFFCH